MSCVLLQHVFLPKISRLFTILGMDELAEPCQSIAEGRFFSFILSNVI
jgi:hypothetical protein